MKNSEELFQLIRSLSGPEKRHFKLISSIYGGDKSYIEVFDILVKQKNYNEQSFRKKLRNKNTIRHLPRIKNYLYEQILQSIASFHVNNSGKSKLNNQIAQIHQLLSRGLTKQARKLIVKAKKLAEDLGLYVVLLEVLRLEKNTANMLFEFERVKAVDMETEETWKHLQTVRRYTALSDAMYALLQHEGQARNKEILAQGKTIMEDPLLKNEKEGINYSAKFLFHQIHSFYSELGGDMYTCYRHRKMLLDLVESHPIRMKENHLDHIIVLNNLLVGMLVIIYEKGKIAEFKTILLKLQAIQPQNSSDKTWKFIYLSMNEQELYLKTGEFEKAVLLQKKISRDKEQYVKIPDTVEFLFLFNFSLAYFGVGDYSKCLKFLNQAIDVGEAVHRKDVQTLIRILNLVVYAELGNELQLPYLLRSVYRYLLKQQRIYKYETYILQFIRKLPKSSSEDKTRIAFVELKSLLEELQKDSFERHAFGNFDIISWLQSKIEKRNFSEIVKEKVKHI